MFFISMVLITFHFCCVQVARGRRASRQPSVCMRSKLLLGLTEKHRPRHANKFPTHF